MKKMMTLLLICLTFSSFANRAAIDCVNKKKGIELSLLFDPTVRLLIGNEDVLVKLTESDKKSLYEAKFFTVETDVEFYERIGIKGYQDVKLVFEKQKDDTFYALLSSNRGVEDLSCGKIQATGLE